ncbi:putative membrane protein [Babesia divergens]|uniref:Membrane protein n=1 Tax=Babesia divergens TaxID=32595 RepID=A0AAD9LGP9_BABDI|nr:putative membrane protein [Babesia divergens]
MNPWHYATGFLLLMVAAPPQLTMSLKQQVKETSKNGFLDFFKLTGDVAPSTYPVLKFNQHVNNDSSFSGLRSRQIQELQEDILRLMPQQRHNLHRIMNKLESQKTFVDELAVAMERQ